MKITWDPYSKGAGVELTNVNRTVITNKEGKVLSTKSTNQGILKWAVKINSDHYGYCTTGIATKDSDLGNFVGCDQHSIGITSAGVVIHNQAWIANTRGYVPDDDVGFILDGNKGTLSIFINGDKAISVRIPAGEWHAADGASSGGQTRSTLIEFYENKSLWEKIKEFFKNLV